MISTCRGRFNPPGEGTRFAQPFAAVIAPASEHDPLGVLRTGGFTVGFDVVAPFPGSVMGMDRISRFLFRASGRWSES